MHGQDNSYNQMCGIVYRMMTWDVYPRSHQTLNKTVKRVLKCFNYPLNTPLMSLHPPTLSNGLLYVHFKRLWFHTQGSQFSLKAHDLNQLCLDAQSAEFTFQVICSFTHLNKRKHYRSAFVDLSFLMCGKSGQNPNTTAPTHQHLTKINKMCKQWAQNGPRKRKWHSKRI